MVVQRLLYCDLRSGCWRTDFGISLFWNIWLSYVIGDMRSEHWMPFLTMLDVLVYAPLLMSSKFIMYRVNLIVYLFYRAVGAHGVR